MTISDIEVIFLRCPVPEPKPRPTGSFVFSGSILLKVHTDEGIVGLGEPGAYGGTLEDIKHLIEGDIKTRFVGKNPLDVQELTVQEELPGGQGYGNVAYNAAIAGISHALWDIAGKSRGKPVYRLLGKNGFFRDAVRAYASGGSSLENEDPNLVVEEAVRCKELGYTAWKMRPSSKDESSHFMRQVNPPEFDENRFLSMAREVRKAVGNDMDLLVDLGCRCRNLEQAVEIAGELEKLSFYFIEEPLPRDPELYSRLAGRVNIPIAGGECLISRSQFKPWFENKSYDIIQPDGNLAGITEGLEIAAEAETNSIPCIIHNWANAVSIAANVHLAAAVPNCPMIEFGVTYNPLRTELVKAPIVPEKGLFHLPDRPGLGIELDDRAVDRYRFEI